VPPGAVSDLIPGATPPAVPSLIGFTVTVADLDATRALLAERDVPFEALGDTVLVPAPHAAGAVVTFTAGETGDRPPDDRLEPYCPGRLRARRMPAA
jgi:hypothetical protein